MRNLKIPSGITRTFHKAGFKLKKHSPAILLVAGVTGTVVSAVMACKATLKVNEVIDETKQNVEKINAAVDRGCTEVGEVYDAADGKKELAIVYTQTGVKLAKLYGPAVALGAASLGCILASNNIIHKRNVALAAAYASVDSSFKNYRKRVVDRFGKELDRELKYNLKAKEVEETVVDENGETKVVKKTVQTVDPNSYSSYTFFFDDGCKGWEKDAEHNKFFLMQVQNWANEKLKAQGHLFMNEVLDMLGIPRTKAGNIVGWIYDEKNPVGDNFVDFGIFNAESERARDFVNGRERVILLEFNVDGNIWELMP